MWKAHVKSSYGLQVFILVYSFLWFGFSYSYLLSQFGIMGYSMNRDAAPSKSEIKAKEQSKIIVSNLHGKEMTPIVSNTTKTATFLTTESPSNREISLFERILRATRTDIPSLHHCNWINHRLRRNASLGKELPKPMSEDPTADFSVKTPILHTFDPTTGAEIMIVKYNRGRQSDSRHRVMNTAKILLTYEEFERQTGSNNRIFPKLHGLCRKLKMNGNGSLRTEALALEYLSTDLKNSHKPQSFEECSRRTVKMFDLFVELDERLHLAHGDAKAGQWMARDDGSFAFQDVDDIVGAGNVVAIPYMELKQMRVLARAHGMMSKEEKQLPDGLYHYFRSKVFPPCLMGSNLSDMPLRGTD